MSFYNQMVFVCSLFLVKYTPTNKNFRLVILLFICFVVFTFFKLQAKSQNETNVNIIENKIPGNKMTENEIKENKILETIKTEVKTSKVQIPLVKKSDIKVPDINEPEKEIISTAVEAIIGGYKGIACDPGKTYAKQPENKITPKYLKILVNPKDICKSNSSFVFNYIFNKVNNFAKREAIRKTWGNKEKFSSLKIAFLVGQSKDENVNKQVHDESLKYGDIIVGNFIDSVRNLSFKSVMAWQWISQECTNADYILKIDDDTVLNTFNFMKYIDSIKINYKNLKNTYFCEVLRQVKPDRRYLGQYFTTCEEYKEEYYKDFCCGVANIITPDLIAKLHEASYTVRPFYVDDVYVGFVTNHLNISMIDVADKIVYNKDKKKRDDQTFLFIRDAETPGDVYSLWDLILKTKS